jgi:hypothetical protein
MESLSREELIELMESDRNRKSTLWGVSSRDVSCEDFVGVLVVHVAVILLPSCGLTLSRLSLSSNACEVAMLRRHCVAETGKKI